ncbi:Uncharacterised protein [Aeromonas encheleia]|uniref:hypothetical protein n=1 Tax=Aeromonas encheleia TaxID=73010 RepID=UPI000F71FB4F|nr:hypothetical protein [Aeromonas encheleia]VEG97055.1 Uncharacterised protein [Aeromonas encheleia]
MTQSDAQKILTYKTKSSEIQSIRATNTPRSLLPFLKYLLAALPLMTAAIYLCGMAYHVGYLEAYGLTNNQFPLATDESILLGFISLVRMLQDKILIAAGVIVGMLSLLILASMTAKWRKALWRKTLIPNLCSKVSLWVDSKRPSKEDSAPYLSWIEWIAILYGVFAVLTVPTALVCAVALFSFLQGVDTAGEEQKHMAKGYFAKHQAQVTLATKDKPMIQVACNTSHCAYWDEDGTTILRHDQINKTLFVPKETKKS